MKNYQMLMQNLILETKGLTEENKMDVTGPGHMLKTDWSWLETKNLSIYIIMLCPTMFYWVGQFPNTC